jgi:hypothetical protein
MLDSPLDSDSNLEDSDSDQLLLSDLGHDSDDDAPQPVAPPSADASTKHLQAVGSFSFVDSRPFPDSFYLVH